MIPPLVMISRHFATSAEMWRASSSGVDGERLGAELGEAAAHGRIGHGGGDLPVQPVDDRARRAARREEAEPGGRLEAFDAGLGGGRDVGERGEALVLATASGADLAGS